VVSAVRLWPNPAADWLWLDGTESPVLYSVSGRKVMVLDPGRNDLRHLSPGVYFVRFAGKNEMVTTKMVLV